MTRKKILVIGDACVDHYVFGQCIRLNPESGAPLLTWADSERKYGMAINVKNNLESLGCDVVSMVPENLSIKTRFIDTRNGQQLLRLDQDCTVNPIKLTADKIQGYDAIVVSDYDKGFVDYHLLTLLEQQANCPVFVDTKKVELGCYKKLIFKINQIEWQRLSQSRHQLPENIIITLGDRGALYKDKIYPTQSSTVVDVCGAGDMFLSALAFHYISSYTPTMSDSINFANQAAGIAIQHQGVYVLNTTDVAFLENNRARSYS